MKFLEIYPDLKITKTYKAVKKRYPKHDNEIMMLLFTVYSPYSTAKDLTLDERKEAALEEFIGKKCDFDYKNDFDIVKMYIDEVLDKEERAFLVAEMHLDKIVKLMMDEEDTDENLLNVRLSANFDRQKQFHLVRANFDKAKQNFNLKAMKDSTEVLKSGMNLSWRDQRFLSKAVSTE